MIATLLVLSGLLGVVAVVAKFYLGIQVMLIVKQAAKWLTGTTEGRAVLVAAIVFLAGWGLFDWGRNYERALWEAKAQGAEITRLNGEVVRLEGERKIAHDRAELADSVLRQIREQQNKAAIEIKQLEQELASAKIQSTQSGARHDPKAYLDDRGRYTPLGARSVRPPPRPLSGRKSISAHLRYSSKKWSCRPPAQATSPWPTLASSARSSFSRTRRSVRRVMIGATPVSGSSMESRAIRSRVRRVSRPSA